MIKITLDEARAIKNALEFCVQQLSPEDIEQFEYDSIISKIKEAGVE